VTQWAVGSLIAGPLAFPAAYILDGALFPASRNHFERAAGLADGDYPPAPDNWPAPRWPDTAAIRIILLLILRRRLRWLSRVTVGGRSQARAHAARAVPFTPAAGPERWTPDLPNGSTGQETIVRTSSSMNEPKSTDFLTIR
jgi:hypothetical protein